MTNKDFELPSAQQPLLSAFFWLAQLVRFRLRGQLQVLQPHETHPALRTLDELVLELGEAVGSWPEPIDSPPAIPVGGWIPEVARAFSLNPLEALVLVAALAPSFDGRFAHAFGLSQGLNRPERATVDLLGRLLALTLPERMWLASRLRVGGALEKYALLRMDFSGEAALPPNLQPLEVPEVVRWYVGGEAYPLPPSIRRYSRLLEPRFEPDAVPMPMEGRRQAENCLGYVVGALEETEQVPVLVLEGPPGAGQLEVCEVVAGHLGLSILEVDLGALLMGGEPPNLAGILRREAVMRQALLYMKATVDEQLAVTASRRVKSLLGDELAELPLPIVMTGALASLAQLRDIGRLVLRVELRLPDRDLQRQVLGMALVEEGLEAAPQALEDLLNRYNIDLETAWEVVRTARSLTRSLRDEDGTLLGHELEGAIDMLLSRHLGHLSQRLTARFGWKDLVLPAEIIILLKTLRNLIEYRHKVFEQWGMGRKGSSGKGIKALFAGPSGTGKTMAAEVIATDLRMPLYRVDLSAVVSKWVGETEKNLEEIFREAHSSQAILLFDEADALFGKRGKVDNANDRHANLEVSFLLQRFETHDGVVILTTNFPSVIDNAFARRMHFLVDFPMPDEKMRKILWRKMLAPPLPVSKEIDVAFLAQRFEISAANIRNSVMGAAFLAAAEDQVVGISQLVRALSWECQKIGRTVSATDFGRYYKLLDVAPRDEN